MSSSFELVAKVQQAGAGVVRDGDRSVLRMNRERALQVNSREGLVDQWVRQGRVWTASNPVIGQPETMSAAGTAYTLTAPSLRFTVPQGCLVVPLHVQFAVGQVTAKNNIMAVLATESDSYSSGGDAVLMTPYNAICAPAGTADITPPTVTNLHYSDTAIVEGTLTRARCLKNIRSEALADSVMPQDFEFNVLKGDTMVYLAGPASFLVYLVQETTAAEAEWSMSWAVLDPAVIGR